LESLEQEVVHVRTVVSDINENLPRLQHFVDELKIFESIAILEDVERS
jgi:hypothetical protein